MIGKYPAKLDDKNRLFVPAKLRSELGESFFVTLGVNCGHRCLTVYTAADWEVLGQNFNNLPISQRSAASSLIFMNATECSPDKQFRFGLTQFLLDYGGISRDVMIVGYTVFTDIFRTLAIFGRLTMPIRINASIRSSVESSLSEGIVK